MFCFPKHQMTSSNDIHRSAPLSMWSPTEFNHPRSTTQIMEEEGGYLSYDSEEDSSRVIHRTFAFDEWDDDGIIVAEDRQKNVGFTVSESSFEKIEKKARKSVHGVFLDDDKTVKRSGTAESFQDIEQKYGSSSATSNKEEASTSRSDTEDMTNILMNPSSFSITKKKLDLNDKKYSAVTPSPTTKAINCSFPLYSYQSFGRATLSSLDTTSATLFLNEDFDLIQTNYVSTPTMCSNKNSPKVLPRQQHYYHSNSHQCESIPRRATAYNNNCHCHGHDHDLTNTKGGPSAHLSFIQFQNRLLISKNQESFSLNNSGNNNCFQRMKCSINTNILQDDDDSIFELPTSNGISASIPKFIMFYKKI